MKKEQPSYDEVEQLLTELAQHDRRVSALDEAQTELMRGAARGEIRRVFRRRRYQRLAGEMAVVTVIGSALYLLRPDVGNKAALAEVEGSAPHTVAPAPTTAVAASPSLRKTRVTPAVPSPGVSYENHAPGCELVIYSVPL